MTEPSALPVRGAKPPTVIVDDLHVQYRVYGTGRAAKGTNGTRTRGTRLVHALRGVSFTAYEGESIGVVGHNGSGKSTLMKTLAGLVPASSGAVYASSQPSFLGVGAALLSSLSGEKNVLLGSLALGMSMAEAKAKRDEIVEFSGLGEFIDFPMKTYSSGMSARLKFAIAMSKDHRIMLVDEALAVGDKSFRDRSEARIRQMRDEAGTVFLVSHSMRSILDSCDRAIWIDHGQLRADGRAKDVIKQYQKSTEEL